VNGIDQFINGGEALFFSEVGQVSVTSGGIGTGMPQQGLNVTEA